MKIRFWMLMVMFVGAFAMAACGGGNNTSGDDDGCSDECGEDKPDTPAEKRQAKVDEIVAGFKDLDNDKVKALFHPDHHDLVDQRILKAFDGLREEEGGFFHVEPKAITEEDGKFILPATLKFGAGGEEKSEERSLELVEHEGEWVFKFYQ